MLIIEPKENVLMLFYLFSYLVFGIRIELQLIQICIGQGPFKGGTLYREFFHTQYSNPRSMVKEEATTRDLWVREKQLHPLHRWCIDTIHYTLYRLLFDLWELLHVLKLLFAIN